MRPVSPRPRGGGHSAPGIWRLPGRHVGERHDCPLLRGRCRPHEAGVSAGQEGGEGKPQASPAGEAGAKVGGVFHCL